MIKQQIQKCLFKAITNLNVDIPLEDIVVEIPKNNEHGDYATNIAMRCAKIFKKPPPTIVIDIINELEKDNETTKYFTFKSLSGFLNIRLNDDYLIEFLLTKVNNSFGKSDIGAGKKVLLEFVSANPTGPLHIGHGRWAAIGDVLARIKNHVSFKVEKEFYINDTGKQIENFNNSINAVKNNQEIPEDGYHGHYIKELAALNEEPVQYMIKHQKEVMEKMGVEFDNWFSEKTLHEADKIKAAIEILKKNNITFEKEGALWFKSTEYDDDKDRVLVRSNGDTTYFAADVAYHENKIERGYDQMINIWGADHHGYIARVKAALKALTGDKDFDKLQIILGQLVNLFRDGEPVRMSKRTGEMITLEEVIEEIGSDATRYFLVSRSPDTTLDFDLEVAKKKNDENPVYYIQYAHARICSILRQPEADVQGEVKKAKLEALERKIILAIAQIPDELEQIAISNSIHKLTFLAQELARYFHSFYHEYRVLSDNEEDTIWRLAFIKAIRKVLKMIFDLLGISAQEKM